MEVELLKKKIARLEKARKQAESILENKAQELWESKQALEEKVILRTKELQLAKEKAEQSQKAEQKFLANMSHEIRTPLNAIVGMAHLLNETSLSKEQSEYLNSLKNSSQILQNLISDILDISKIDAGKMEVIKESFDLHKLIKNLIEIFETSALKKQIALILEFDERINPIVYGDTKLLNQVLINLIGNALKFTSEGNVSVRMTQLEKQNTKQHIKIEVVDSGIGISQDKLQAIFEDFTQAESDTDRTYGGTGLGLSISKKIATLLESNLKATSQLGNGSTFYMDLWLEGGTALENRADATNRTSKPSFGPDQKILVVEDNLMNQHYLLSLLDKWNVSYDLANNGEEALKCTSTATYALILMDNQMPIMDGLTATKEIRKTDTKTPIIALTASSMREDKEIALQNGFSDFLTKPFEPNQLLEVLNKFV